MWNCVLMTTCAAVCKSLFRCALWALALCAAFTCHAQSDEGETIPDRGFHSTASYALANIETINTTNGNLMLNIPLAVLPSGRGGSPGFKLLLGYNSKVWDGESDVAQDPNNPARRVNVTWLVQSDQGGWAYNLRGYGWQVYNRNSGGVYYPPPDCRNFNIWKMKVKFPDGGEREFRPYGYDDQCDDNYFTVQPAPGRSYYSTDGTYARLDFGQSTSDWTLSFADGARVVSSAGMQRTYDRNGNYTEFQSVTNYNNTGHPATLIVDQLGRSIAVEFGTNEDYIHAVGVNGETIITTVKWSQTYVKKTYRAGNHYQYDANINQALKAVSEIILPLQLGTNLKYSFGYNGWPTSGNTTPSVGWGELDSITMPSGARVDYQYEMDNKSGSGWQASWVLENAPTRKDLNYDLEYDGTVIPASTETWLYSLSNGFAQITSPDGGITKEWFTNTDQSGGGLVYKTEQPDGSVIERIWKENRPYLPPGVTIYVSEKVNSFVNKEFISVRDPAGTLVKTAIKEYRHDKNGNLVQQFEYDWVPYSSVARDGTGKPTDIIPAGAQLQRLNTISYYCATADASNTTTNDPDSYDKATAPLLRNVPSSTETGDGSQTLARSEFFYDNAFTTGNLTQQKSWDSTKGVYSNPLSTANSISVSHQYDAYHNRTLSTDARGYQTRFIYGSVGGFTDLYPTEVDSAFGTSIQRTQTLEYDFSTGLVTRTTDVDNNVSSETDYDVFGRPIETRAASNLPSVKTVTHVDYSAVDRRVITRSDLSVAYDGNLVSVQHYDQLGRVRLVRQLENAATESATDETKGIKVQTRYLYSGSNSYQTVSNPYRAATSGAASSEVTMGWARTKADNGGRVLEVQTFGGASLPAPWGTNNNSTGTVTTGYDAQFTTVADQAGKMRRSNVDGLGRLVRVDEPDATGSLGTTASPVQPTSYTYDALANLTLVTQGAQTRTFTYDSLSRLKTAANPESGTVTYTYDNNANLLTKRDALSITTTFTYDALNRPTLKNYSDTTPDVAYFYDSQTLPAGAPSFVRGSSRGRLVAVTTGGTSAGSYRGYDAMGHVVRQYQRTDSSNYLVEATYDLTGSLATETYPSVPEAADRRTVSYTSDAAGRLASLNSAATSYAGAASVSSIAYAPHNALITETYGNGLVHAVTYNNRLQPTAIKLGTAGAPTSKVSLTYNYGTTANNGNVQSITYAGGGLSYTQTFGYDALNRLTTSQEGASWLQTNSYDRYGNRSIVGGPLTFNATNNRITTAGYTYDAAGNLTNDGVHAYTFDAENKISKVDNVSAYVYDGEGQRVRKLVNENLRFIYDIGGKQIAEFDGATGALKKEYIYGTGLVATIEPTAVNTNGTRYTTSDQLGSPRVITNSSAGVVSRHDYMPFGEELFNGGRTTGMGYGVADGIRQKFTSKERDNETGLDYFIHRYYASTQGRFTGPDPYVIFFEMKRGQDAEEQIEMLNEYIGQPQNWARYSYGLNNPLNHTDPTGMRPPNKYEQAALNRLDQMAAQEGDSDLGNGLRAARATIASIIDGLGKGKSDVGVNVAVNAVLNIGNSNFSEQGSVTIGSANGGITIAFGPGTSNKCNVFVAGAYADGAGLDFVKNGGRRRGYPLVGGKPPAANWLGDSRDTQKLSNLGIVTDGSLRPGDIVAWRNNDAPQSGHSSIHIGGNVLVYAGGPPDGSPQARTLNYVDDRMGGHQPYVVRRYSGKP